MVLLIWSIFGALAFYLTMINYLDGEDVSDPKIIVGIFISIAYGILGIPGFITIVALNFERLKIGRSRYLKYGIYLYHPS